MSALSDLRALLRERGFRNLVNVRLLSQGGDGMFQIGIGTAFFFDPQQATSTRDIALGFLVLLAPFTLVGPWVGPLVDRWQRQRIILVGNLVRVALTGAVILLYVTDAPLWSLYTVTLLTLSVNRFLLAAMTAGIPQVSPRPLLLTANSILPTLGTIAAVVGAGVGSVITFLRPDLSNEDPVTALAALTGAAIAFGLSSLATLALRRRELGPNKPLEALRFFAQVRELGTELRQGFTYIRARVTPLHALGVMAAQRMLYGMMFVTAIIVSRELLSDPMDPAGGVDEFSIVLAFAAAGFILAAVVTPALGHRVSRHRWVVTCLGIGAIGQGALAISSSRWALLTAAVVVSFAVQGAKIAVDTIVQRDTVDRMRGRAFTLYDFAYNTAFMFAAAAMAGLSAIGALPKSGYSSWVMSAIAAFYISIAALYAGAPSEPVDVPEDVEAPASADGA